MYKSLDKLVCIGTITITYIQRPKTRYVKIYKDEFTLMIYMYNMIDKFKTSRIQNMKIVSLLNIQLHGNYEQFTNYYSIKRM